MTARTLAIFDFDHTITSWDSAARFFVWLIRRSYLKLLAVVFSFPALGPLLISVRTRQVPLRFGAWVATFGSNHEELVELARRHIREVRAQGEKFVGADARARINHHLSLGHEVVVVTGSLELLANEILCAEGIGSVRVVGTTVRKLLGGMVVVEHCFGERKVPMLEERGFRGPWAFVYSDHEADLPLFERGSQRYIVNPKPRSAARLVNALGSSAVVVRWN